MQQTVWRRQFASVIALQLREGFGWNVEVASAGMSLDVPLGHQDDPYSSRTSIRSRYRSPARRGTPIIVGVAIADGRRPRNHWERSRSGRAASEDSQLGRLRS
jgi:hypothetical protein